MYLCEPQRFLRVDADALLIFDIVLPFESKLSPADAKKAIGDAINAIRNDLFCVITVDRG